MTRRARVALVVLLGAGVLAGMAGGLARVRLDTTVGSFLPSGDPAVRAWHGEQASFGADPIAVVLTADKPGELLAGTALRKEVRLEGELAGLPDTAVVYGPGTTLNEIARSLRGLLASISGDRDALMTRAEVVARQAGKSPAQQAAAGQAAVYHFDLRYGALLAHGLKIGLPTLANPNFGPSVFLGAHGQGRPAFRWLVPDASHEAILIRPAEGLDQARTEALVTRVRRTVRRAGLPVRSSVVTGSPAIASSMGQEVRDEAPLLAPVALAAVALCFLVIGRRRPWWERLVPLGVGVVATLATLSLFSWAGVPLSVGLLAFLPIILGVGTDYPIYALRGGRVRLVLATMAASALSLAGLAVSPLPFVRDLGLALAVGIALSALLGLLLARWLPVASTTRPDPAPAAGRHPRGGPRSLPAPPPGHRRRGARLALAAVALGAAVAGWVSLGSLRLNSNPERLAAGLPALRQGLAAQSVLGASGELDVYVRAPDVVTPAFLSWYRRAEQALIVSHGDQLRPVVSPAALLGWLGPHPSRAQINAAMGLLPSYLSTAAVRDDRRQAVMAYGVRLGSLGSERRLIRAIRADLPPAPPGARVTVTGLPAVAARGYQLLSGDRLWPNLGAIAVFGAALWVFLGRRRWALLAVVAAGMAVGWGFLALWLTGTALSPLTVSLGSLTSAVGGEFTVMALARREAGASARAGEGGERWWSAVVAAAATSVVGFGVLGLSRLAVLRQFGVVLAGSVALALVAAWVVVSLGSRPGGGPAGGEGGQRRRGDAPADAEEALV